MKHVQNCIEYTTLKHYTFENVASVLAVVYVLLGRAVTEYSWAGEVQESVANEKGTGTLPFMASTGVRAYSGESGAELDTGHFFRTRPDPTRILVWMSDPWPDLTRPMQK